MTRLTAICSACGVTWATGTTECAACDADVSRRTTASLQSHDLVWVAAFARFTCGDCGESSRMLGLETDCRATCVHCGETQLLEPDSLRDAMAMAWEAADHLVDPLPLDDEKELRIDAASLRGLGTHHAVIGFSDHGISPGSVVRSRAIRMDLLVGRPLCEVCRALLETRMDGDELVVRCAECDTTARYRRPENPEDIAVMPVAILDGALRADAVAARPATGPTWLAFRGPSPTRQALARAASRRAEAAARPARRTVDVDGDPIVPMTEAQRRNAKVLGIVSVVAVAGLVALLLVGERREAPPGPAARAASAAPPPPPPPIELAAACGCPSGGGMQSVRWTVVVRSTMRLGADLTVDVDYGWRLGRIEAPMLASATTAPPDPIRVARLELGVACVGDTVLVADGRHLTAWSRAARRTTASVAAESPFGPLPEPSAPVIDCYAASFEDGALVFDDAGGFAHRIPVPAELVAPTAAAP